MEMVVIVLKCYFVFTIIIMLLYTFRHIYFTLIRLYSRQKMGYTDIYDSDLPSLTVLIPMHNEEQVMDHILKALLEVDYDKDKLEIIPINDHSTDHTKEILDDYASKYPLIKPLHRSESERGKPVALNEGMARANGDIIVVFDADYRPGKSVLKSLVMTFKNIEIGAVMGRVTPYNVNKNLLTKLLHLERSGGYQVDQQARYSLNLIPQYGGTVGGFRKQVLLDTGGFDTCILAEDTELTFRMYMKGYKVGYVNNCECYEESPETWEMRGRQVRRWSRGHNQVMFRYVAPLIRSKQLNIEQKIDGLFLLFIYMVPVVLFFGLISAVALFFLGEMEVFGGVWALFFVMAYNSYGNFAPFYQIATGALLDGMKHEIMLLPCMMFNFYFYLWHITLGFKDAVVDLISRRQVKWDKTKRFS